MTDAEALDALTADMNAEPIDAYRTEGWSYVRRLLRATGRTVKDAIPLEQHPEAPPSGY